MPRVLTTAMVVAYMRPFTGDELVAPKDFIPTEGPDAELHEYLRWLRNKVYAHNSTWSHRGM